tara:strand:+ start:8396 stop:9313 length:918 start_codon:yes stop_codon:yes gene_type:complete
MEWIFFMFCFLILLIISIKIIRRKLFLFITELDNEGKFIETNKFYNNYFLQSEHKENRKLINNVAFIRDGFISNIYDADLNILKINELDDGDFILNFNNKDCNFDIFIAQYIINLNKNIKIISAKTNLLDMEKCKKMINSLGYEKYINIIFINDTENINQGITIKFKRIILRENIGDFKNRNLLIKQFKVLLYDSFSFLYLKTLTFNPIKDNDYILKKQFDIIDFWNYNFSTDSDIINEFVILDYKVKYKKINIILLSIFYNPDDIINLLKLYFVDLDLKISDLINWLGVYTINLLNLKAYPDMI